MVSNLVFNKQAVHETLSMADSIMSLKYSEQDNPSLMVTAVYEEDFEQLLNLATHVSDWLGISIITEPDEENGTFKIWISE